MDARLCLSIMVIAVVVFTPTTGTNHLQTDTGRYSFMYVDSRSSRQEQGSQNDGQLSQGGWRYTSPEGVPVAITFVADHGGYQPTGSVIPVAPPLPYQRSGN